MQPSAKFDRGLFSLSSDIQGRVYEVGQNKNKILEIKNVLANPKDVTDFLEAIPAENKVYEGSSSMYPGHQIYLEYDFGDLGHMLAAQMSQIFETAVNSIKFAYQYTDGKTPIFNQSNFPHCDQENLAGNLFLNTEEELKNNKTGTALYSLKETGEESYFPSMCAYRTKRYGFSELDKSPSTLDTIEENDRYKMYHLLEGEHNTMHIYEGALFHALYMKSGTFRDITRKTLSITVS